MLEWMSGNPTVIWAVLMVLFLIVEALTAQLTTIWFAVGALAAVIVCLCNGALWLQITCFLVVSVAALYLTRPLVRRFITGKTQATNADRVIGMVGLVTEAISESTGAVSVDGKVWTARSEHGDRIETGRKVIGTRIEGVKLYVRPAEEENQTDSVKTEG